MKNKIYKFFASAFIFWFVSTFSAQILPIPEKIINIAIFLPPILGLMFGIPAALGVYFGGLLIISEIKMFDGFFYFLREFWIFLAAYIPFFLWQKILIYEEKFSLSVHTLKKFLAIMFITFAATSIFRAFTSTSEEIETIIGLFGFGKSYATSAYILVCFLNDFFITIFFDLAIFFFFIKKFFMPSTGKEINRAWQIALIFYLLFPFGVAYIIKYQIYGMERIETWINFIAECLSIIDIYLILMLYFLLRYRRSIMLEIVFLVTQTVFLTAIVLGFRSSIFVGNLVNNYTNDSLRAMSVICRERLYRTFFSVRQAVNGMKLQALDSIESYERLTEDENYRKNYLERMKNNFNFISLGIDGSISYYLRFIPEIDGSKGGFSLQREDARWEGNLSPFVDREPIDLSLYSPDDNKNVGWFYTPMKSHSATWIEPYVDAITNFYVISYVAPLFFDGKFIGVVGMDIDFNFIIQELRRMSIYDYGYVYIMDRNNIVLYHKDQPQGSIFRPNPEFQEMEVYLSNGMWLGIATPLSKVNEEKNIISMHSISAIIIVAMLISIASILLASKAIKPLAGMTEAAKRIASGDLNVKISYESGNELGILVKSIREMASRLEIYVYRDKLTGLRNAASYIVKAAELDEKNKIISDLSYGVVIFDANFLKKVNDKYGHEAGNELLRRAAKVIREVFSNSPVYRTGGDEFAAILEGEDYENRQELLKLFDKKVDEEHFIVAGDTLTLSVARGLGIYESGMDFSTVSKKADVAMYEHKSAIKAKFGEEVR